MGTTEETINGYKLMKLIIECGTEALRNVFKSCHKDDLETVLGDYQPFLKNLMKRNILTSFQWEKLFPPTSKKPNIDEFDITLLFALLRNICEISAPIQTGWTITPDDKDISREADIVRVRTFRNEFFAHVTRISVSATEFEARWEEIKMPLIRLDISETKIDRIKKEIISPKLPLTLWDFSTDIELCYQKYCKGTREWVFDQVNKWFNDKTSDNSIFMITGQAGMGKTIIAAAICKTFSEQLGACHFCQVGTDKYNNQRNLLQSLAHQLSNVLCEYKTALTEKLFLNRQEMEQMPIEDLFLLLFRDPLGGIQFEKRLIIVIDAVDEIDDASWSDFVDLIARNLEQLPTFIRFLITSRPHEKFNELNPLKLSPDDEQNLEDIRHVFQEKLSLSPEKKQMDQLVHKSAGFMSQAINYVKSHT